MRHCAAEMLDVEKAVNRVTVHIEEDRVRHWRIVAFLGVVVGVHAVRLEGAARRVVAGAPGRDWPDITLRTIDSDRHLLRALVDCDEDASLAGAASTAPNRAPNKDAASRRRAAAWRAVILPKHMAIPDDVLNPR